MKLDVSKDIIKQVKKDVKEHRLLVFKDQGIISGDRQVEIGQWFGKVEEQTPKGHKHKKMPNKDVLRVSNDVQEGNIKVGTAGKAFIAFLFDRE